MHSYTYRCHVYAGMGSDSKVAVVVGASKGVGLAVWSHAIVLPLHYIGTDMFASLQDQMFAWSLTSTPGNCSCARG